MDSNFSNNLKAARLARRFSQQQMADELGISRSAYAGYEIKRRSPSIELLQKLATVLQVSVDDLLGYGPLDTSNMITEAKVQYNVTPRAFSVEEYLNRPDCTLRRKTCASMCTGIYPPKDTFEIFYGNGTISAGSL